MNRNGMALPDSGMTMKVRDENETVKGFLDQQGETAESGLQYQERQTKALEGLAALVDRSQRRQARDPVLIEHQALEKSEDRQSVVSGKSVSVRVDLGGRRILKKKTIS